MNELIENRTKTHGLFEVNSRISQSLKKVLTSEQSWDSLSDQQREALCMIMHKVSRILAGDSTHNDHWLDIAGYAILCANKI